MARIGKIVTFTGSRETLTEKILLAISRSTPISPINFSFTNDGTMNIYGDSVDLTALKVFLENKGFTFTVGGNAPTEQTPTPPADPPNWDETILKQAFENMKEEDRSAFWVRVQAEYTALGGTGSPPRVDFKWLR